MTNQIMEGWDTYPTGAAATALAGTNWNIVSGGLSVATDQAANGTRSAKKTAGAGSNILTQAIATDNIVCWGARHYYPSFVAGNADFGVGPKAAANSLFTAVDGSGRVILRRNGTTLYTSTEVVSIANWNYIDAVYNRSAGTCDVYLNGNLIQTVTTITDIGALVSLGVGSVHGAFVNTTDIWFDDIYCNTGNNRWGEIGVILLAPDADTAQADWTITGPASGYQVLDNVPPDPAAYLEAINVGDISEFEIPETPVGTFQVFGIRHRFRSQKTTAGAADVTGRLVVGGNVYAGANRSVVQGSYTTYSDLYELNPDTGLPWVPADFIGANVLIGYERTA